MKRSFTDALLDDGECTRVFAGSLSFQTTWKSLKDHFKVCGEIQYASVITDRATGMSKGCGMVDFQTHAEAQSAVAVLNGSTLDGREITVKLDVEGKRRQAMMVQQQQQASAYGQQQPRVVDDRPGYQLPANQIKRVFVGNLSFTTNWQALKDHCAQAGEVELATVLLQPDRTSKGCGMVDYKTHQEAAHAADVLNNTELDGRKISVKLDVDGTYRAKPPPGSRPAVYQVSREALQQRPSPPMPWVVDARSGQTQQHRFQQPLARQASSLPGLNESQGLAALQSLSQMAAMPGASSFNWPQLIQQVTQATAAQLR